MVSDDREKTGFDCHDIGAKFIGQVFSACRGLQFSRELRTELYRVQLFGKVHKQDQPVRGAMPRELVLRSCADLRHPRIRRGGCVETRTEARRWWNSSDVPLLMYHRISADGPDGLAAFRVTPGMFERQLSWLSRHGYESIGLDACQQRRFDQGGKGWPGKPIVLTFDDAYRDFITDALPLLQQYGFGAIVFVPTDYVGGSAEWDKRYGEPAELMTWDELRKISSAGIEIGSHSCCHRLVTTMKPDELLSDSLVSRMVLESELRTRVTGYCYPYGSANEQSREVIRAAGYEWAVCGVPDAPLPFDPCYMPRIEIVGGESLEQFIQRLPKPRPADSFAG